MSPANRRWASGSSGAAHLAARVAVCSQAALVPQKTSTEWPSITVSRASSTTWSLSCWQVRMCQGGGGGGGAVGK